MCCGLWLAGLACLPDLCVALGWHVFGAPACCGTVAGWVCVAHCAVSVRVNLARGPLQEDRLKKQREEAAEKAKKDYEAALAQHELLKVRVVMPCSSCSCRCSCCLLHCCAAAELALLLCCICVDSLFPPALPA